MYTALFIIGILVVIPVGVVIYKELVNYLRD